MTQISIFFPVIALVFLTFIVAVLMGYKRVKAAKNKEINVHYFRLNSGYDCPAKLTQISQNYDNLLALPNLFYLGCIISFITNQVDFILLSLAWAFVISLYIHSYIHIGSNRLKYRYPIFFFSVIVLIIFWIILSVKILI